MKPPTKNCLECAESILAEAKVCRYCGHSFPTQNVKPTPNVKPTQDVKCFNCNHVQAVLASQTEYTCEQCGQRLKRKHTTLPAGG